MAEDWQTRLQIHKSLKHKLNNMKCPNCNHENDATARFCRNCGRDLSNSPTTLSDGSENSSVLLLVFISIIFCSGLIKLCITTFVDNWYTTKGIYGIYTLLWIVDNISMILPALAIKQKPLKIAGLILAIIYAGYCVTMNILDFIHQLEYLE